MSWHELEYELGPELGYKLCHELNMSNAVSWSLSDGMS